MGRVLLLLSLLILLATPSPVSAIERQPTSLIQIYPSIISLSLRPGATQKYEVNVRNASDVPMPIHLSVESFQLQDEDSSGVPPPTLGSWTTITPEDMILASGEAKKVIVEVQLPSKIPLGGYYANMVVEPKIAAAQSSGSNAQVETRLIVLLLGSIGVPTISSDNGVVHNDRSGDIFLSPKIPIAFTVKNTSLYHFSAKPFIKIKPLFGPTEETELEEKITLPGRKRSWDTLLKVRRPYHLIYKEVIAVSIGGGEKIIDTTYILIIPKQIQLGLTALGCGLLVLLMIRRRVRIKRALRILFSGEDHKG